MDERDTRMLIKACIERVFVPQVLGAMGVFLKDYSEKIIAARDMQNAFGINVLVGEPSRLEIAQPMQNLEDALVAALKSDKPQ